ncbi:MAG TPA: hypothetical protein VGB30_02015 [bacterium]|jgi:hypothetical protein
MVLSKNFGTPENLIEVYNLTWEVNNSAVQPEFNSYTIIAFPWVTNQGFLTTYGIKEDEVIRFYDPENDLDDLNTWIPIL